MDFIIDYEGLGQLLRNFSMISGMRFTLLDSTFQIVYASYNRVKFCSLINSTEIGSERCKECDARLAGATAKGRGLCVAPCHAGLIDAVLPVIQDEQVLAYLFFGQVLDSSKTREESWKESKRMLDWYDNVDNLKDSFLELQMYTMDSIRAYANILNYCMPYLWLEGLIKSSEATNRQKIAAYINANYAKRITLDDMSSAMFLSKTKLCEEAKAQKTTIMKMVANKRIDVAKRLLRTTDYPISVIAERVGISDYNYFSKFFMKYTGTTPREYRSRK